MKKMILIIFFLIFGLVLFSYVVLSTVDYYNSNYYNVDPSHFQLYDKLDNVSGNVGIIEWGDSGWDDIGAGATYNAGGYAQATNEDAGEDGTLYTVSASQSLTCESSVMIPDDTAESFIMSIRSSVPSSLAGFTGFGANDIRYDGDGGWYIFYTSSSGVWFKTVFTYWGDTDKVQYGIYNITTDTNIEDSGNVTGPNTGTPYKFRFHRSGGGSKTFYIANVSCWIGSYADKPLIDTTKPSWKYNMTNFTSIKVNENGQFNITAEDNEGLNTIILSFNNNSAGWENISTQRMSGTLVEMAFNETISTTRGQTQEWKFYINDSVGNWNETDLFQIIISNTNPIISLSNPANLTIEKTNYSVFNWTSSDADSDTLTHYLYNCSRDGTTYNNLYSGTSLGYNWTGLNTEGNYYWLVNVSDTIVNISSEIRQYTISITNPAVNLRNPTDNIWLTNGTDIIFNVTASDDNGLDTALFYTNLTGAWEINQTLRLSGIDLTFNFTLNLTDLFMFWNVWVNDTVGDENFYTVKNYTMKLDTTYPQFNITSPIEGQSFSTQTITITNNVTDTNLDTCYYSIYLAEVPVVSNDSMDCNGQETYNTGAWADWTFYGYAEDYPGLINSSGAINFSTTEAVVTAEGGGGLMVIEDESIIDYRIPILTYTIFPIKKINTKDFIIQNIGNTTFKGSLFVSKELINKNFNATICDIGFTDCKMENINIDVGESKVLMTQHTYNKDLFLGTEGFISLKSETKTFELPTQINRPPFYYSHIKIPFTEIEFNLGYKMISDEFGVNEFFAFIISYITIFLGGGYIFYQAITGKL